MNDLIDRQAAINAIENTDCELSSDAWDELTDAIMNLLFVQPETCEYWDSESNYCALYRPSAQPEQRWIPVTERLPEKDKEVLITAWKDTPMIAWIAEDNMWYSDGYFFELKTEVLAWMPLPELYREKKEKPAPCSQEYIT